MANHSSSLKRIRQSNIRRLRNKYVYKSTRTAIKQLINGKKNKDKYSKVISMIDKLAKKNIIHMNKAARLKNRLIKRLWRT
ncbi:MAG: 30S ribosomal protein S20 [Flavobacteriales bacterium]|jgi:small subunit ribosomal protein S20|uniref:30S ribosomal protein S20 n=1 Tax=Blattabacterium sp. (Mastotermes darwiniensis) TaxID=39768 RepID=UPI000231DFB1|nr:30S ribosomal protein S20 [Blattabacterium sp. (Mastotermes darwiniensis)]AER40457.1 30S ribosomal protein S20 [Blattabacterium sp. (Mastotermes darwiniensis) str. MADAR]MDR1805027.1 30S ribosomal protein S20 [Flavobacteriales bacterium]